MKSAYSWPPFSTGATGSTSPRPWWPASAIRGYPSCGTPPAGRFTASPTRPCGARWNGGNDSQSCAPCRLRCRLWNSLPHTMAGATCWRAYGPWASRSSISRQHRRITASRLEQVHRRLRARRRRRRLPRLRVHDSPHRHAAVVNRSDHHRRRMRGHHRRRSSGPPTTVRPVDKSLADRGTGCYGHSLATPNQLLIGESPQAYDRHRHQRRAVPCPPVHRTDRPAPAAEQSAADEESTDSFLLTHWVLAVALWWVSGSNYLGDVRRGRSGDGQTDGRARGDRRTRQRC